MPSYKFRYFFSPGAGVCLWSGDELTEKQFDLPVDPKSLGLTDNLFRRMLYLVAWFDTSIDWDYPPDPSPWSKEELLSFTDANQKFLRDLRQHLGTNYEILDES
jgi:hypothetical protein